MPEVSAQPLLKTPTVTVRDVCCRGNCKHMSAEECASAAHLVFPYRGVFMRHLGRDQAVAEANQVLFFNPTEGYRVSHPVTGRRRQPGPGDRASRCCASWRRARLLRDGATRGLPAAAPAHRSARAGAGGAAPPQPARKHRRVAGSRKPGADAGAARAGAAHHACSRRQRRPPAAGRPRQAGAGQRPGGAGRWPRSPRKSAARRSISRRSSSRSKACRSIATSCGCGWRVRSIFLPSIDDLTALGLDLGFSSHSHFSAAFREAYGRTPPSSGSRRSIADSQQDR